MLSPLQKKHLSEIQQTLTSQPEMIAFLHHSLCGETPQKLQVDYKSDTAIISLEYPCQNPEEILSAVSSVVAVDNIRKLLFSKNTDYQEQGLLLAATAPLNERDFCSLMKITDTVKRSWAAEMPQSDAPESLIEEHLLTAFQTQLSNEYDENGNLREILYYDEDYGEYHHDKYGYDGYERVPHFYNDETGEYEKFSEGYNLNLAIKVSRLIWNALCHHNAEWFTHNIHQLCLNTSDVPELPTYLTKLSNLRTLTIVQSGFDLSNADVIFPTLSKLEKLEMTDIELTELPSTIGMLHHLQELICPENALTHLPEEIGLLSQLRILNLNNNNITELPATLTQLTNLQRLELHQNPIATLPKGFSQLQQLTHLEIENAVMTQIPTEIASLRNLSHFRWNTIDAPDFLLEIPGLTGVHLHKKLGLSKKEMYNLDRITNLDISQALSTLPESISALQNLQSLKIRANQLQSLPDSIGELSKLHILRLQRNQLSEIPDSIGKLTQLTVLNLATNQLTTLPESISQLTNLRELFLSHNRFSADEKIRIQSLLPKCKIVFN